MVDVLQRDHALAAARRLRKAELDRLRLRSRRLDLLHPLDLLELALRLRGFAGLGAEAVGEFLQRRDLLLLVLVSGELLLFARRFLFDVVVVVAAVTERASCAISTMVPTS